MNIAERWPMKYVVTLGACAACALWTAACGSMDSRWIPSLTGPRSPQPVVQSAMGVQTPSAVPSASTALPAAPAVAPFEGEDAATPVQPLPRVRQPFFRNPAAASQLLAQSNQHTQIPASPPAQPSLAQALADAFTVSERLKTMAHGTPQMLATCSPWVPRTCSATDWQWLHALWLRAASFGALAQADFASEPIERRGHLRGIALQAALAAHAEASTNIPWNTAGCDCPEDYMDVRYDYAVLLEQAGNYDKARAMYKELIRDKTHSNHVGRSHLGLAMIEEAVRSPSQDLTVPDEFHRALDVLDCIDDQQHCWRDEELKQFIIEHIQAGYLDKWAEFQEARRTRARHMAEAAAEAQATAEVWGPVVKMADEIARRRWIIEYSRKNHTHPESVLQREEAAIIRQTVGGYCPAKKAFVAKKGVAEFSKRAVLHCNDDPPKGSTTGQTFVADTDGNSSLFPLTAQCQRTFASQCP